MQSSRTKPLCDLFNTLSVRHSRYTVWYDFVVMSACAISNLCDMRYHDERETLYAKSAEKYNAEELGLFSEMLAQTMLALHERPHDFLGAAFMEMSLSNEWRGQFFTPDSVGEMMAAINAPGLIDEINKNGWASVSDPACGAGCLLIAVANQLAKAGIDCTDSVVYYAQDVDTVAALMCYIQLASLGCKAVIKIGNTLSDPYTTGEDTESIWYTPAYVAVTQKTTKSKTGETL